MTTGAEAGVNSAEDRASSSGMQWPPEAKKKARKWILFSEP